MASWKEFGYGLAGGFSKDREEKRKALQLEAAKAGFQYNEQTGQYSASNENYQGKMMEAMSQQLEALKATMMNNETWSAVTAGVEAGSYEGVNKLINRPEYKDLFASQGVTGIRTLSRDNANDMDTFKGSLTKIGYSEEDAAKILDVTKDEESWQAIQKAFPVITDPTGSSKIISVEDINLALGGAKRADAIKTSKILGDVYANGVNALKGRLSSFVEEELKAKELENETTSLANKSNSLKLIDMENYLQQNPGATLADYVSMQKQSSATMTTSSLEKETEYIRQNYGEEAANAYLDKKISKPDSDPAIVKTEKYNTEKINSMIQESGVKDLYDVDYTKLSPENRTMYTEMARDQAKDIKAEERDALFTLSTAANKLNVEDLKNVTGIADATLGSLFDRLGLNLPTKDLQQSANYNLIKNSIIKAAMGSQVTGNELERINAQLGTEFRADKTVRIKMAETLDSIVAKYESYKLVAPAFYGYAMKPQVENMKKMSAYLTSEGKTAKNDSTPKDTGKKQAPLGTEIKNPTTGVVMIMTEQGWKTK